MSNVLREFNCHRRAHRINAPLWVNMNGKNIQVIDWSLVGIALDSTHDAHTINEEYEADCIIPMDGATLSLSVKLIATRIESGVTGLSFVGISEKVRQLLRHYMEMVLEGRAGDPDSLMSIYSRPVISSPIKEPLPLSDTQSNQLKRTYILKSSITLILGLALLLLIISSIIFQSFFKITGIGQVHIDSTNLTTNYSGFLYKKHTPTGETVEKGTELFTLKNPELETKIENINSQIYSLNNQIKMVRRLFEKHNLQTEKISHPLKKNNNYSYIKASTKNINPLHYTKNTKNTKNFIKDTIKLSAKSHDIEYFKVRSKLDNQILQLSAQLNTILQQQESLTIKSPSDGRLTKYLKSQGEYLNKGEKIAVFTPITSQFYITAQLPIKDTLTLSIGRLAKVYFPNNKQSYSARIIEILPSSSNSSNRIQLELLETVENIAAGSSAKIWFNSFDWI